MTYACLKQQIFAMAPYTLEPLQEKNLAAIKEWRNEQMEVLRQNALLRDQDQKRYWEQVLSPSMQEVEPSVVLFGFHNESNLIGYGGVTHLDWVSKRGELSFLVETSRAFDKIQYERDFLVFLELIKQAVFGTLELHRLFTETFAFRSLHIAVLEKSGFQLEGKMKEHVWIKDRYVDSLIHGYVRKE